jgi:hypothetical protein
MDAAHYRRRASELREMSQSARDHTAREELLRVAEEYERQAEHAERAEEKR